MKKNLLLILIVLPFFAYSQQIIMQNGIVNNCSGTFLDSGGLEGNYSSNENFVITICPDTPGQKVELNFTEFATQLNSDQMTIFNGDSVNSLNFGVFSGTGSPGFISSNNNDNPSGCLTIAFISDASGNTLGWEADILCVESCQIITSQLDSAIPMPNSDGVIKVCTNENITLNGSGSFEFDGTDASYEWDLGDGNIASGQTATFFYESPGVYIVNLNIRDANTTIYPSGCPNTNLINQIIQVAPQSDFAGTQANDETLCFGESTTITGVVSQTPVVYNCPPPVTGVTGLPDGSGVTYYTCAIVDCFESGATLTDISQILDICMNMEHSYLGDLEITIVSPNGQRAILKAFSDGGGSLYLGGANDSDTDVPGVGADYCFSMSGNVLLVDGPTVIAGSNPPNNSIAPGTYLPTQSFESLLGSPINGEWCLEVVDNLAIDNGYIFSWELNLDANIPIEEFSFTPETVSESWDADPSIIEVNGSTITVSPQTAGVTCYTYRVINDFGCEETQEVCVTVAEESAVPMTYYSDNDGDGFGDPDNFIVECNNIIPQGYVDNDADCDDTNDAINGNATDIPDNGIDENCDGEDGVLSVNDFNFDDFLIYPNPFTNKVSLRMPLNFNGDIDIKIYDLNGRMVLETSEINVNGSVILNNLDKLENAPYFIEVMILGTGVSVIKRLIKL
ncbi:MAG: PKD domain-containing protein [Aquaticitalea sp.]